MFQLLVVLSSSSCERLFDRHLASVLEIAAGLTNPHPRIVNARLSSSRSLQLVGRLTTDDDDATTVPPNNDEFLFNSH